MAVVRVACGERRNHPSNYANCIGLGHSFPIFRGAHQAVSRLCDSVAITMPMSNWRCKLRAMGVAVWCVVVLVQNFFEVLRERAGNRCPQPTTEELASVAPGESTRVELAVDASALQRGPFEGAFVDDHSSGTDEGELDQAVLHGSAYLAARTPQSGVGP